ncbi:MAG: hypothetical protein RIF32_12425 [Leptospirales bacterium]
MEDRFGVIVNVGGRTHSGGRARATLPEGDARAGDFIRIESR